MNKVRKELQRIVRKRKLLMTLNESRKNRAAMMETIELVEKHLAAWPSATDRQLCRWLSKHRYELQELCPPSWTRKYKRLVRYCVRLNKSCDMGSPAKGEKPGKAAGDPFSS